KELYIGLNDLHLDLNMRFIFEPLANGLVDEAAALVAAAGQISFGFGGVARMNEGLVPGRLVLSEHIRLGSSTVILSRTFHRGLAGRGQLGQLTQFANEVGALREEEEKLRRSSHECLKEN